MIHAAPSTQAFIIFGVLDYREQIMKYTNCLTGDAERKVWGVWQILLLLFGWRTKFVQRRWRPSLSVRWKGEVPCWREPALMKAFYWKKRRLYTRAAPHQRGYTRVVSRRLNRHLDAVSEGEKHTPKRLFREDTSTGVERNQISFLSNQFWPAGQLLFNKQFLWKGQTRSSNGRPIKQCQCVGFVFIK